jgi:non-heme chloroperoxidase
MKSEAFAPADASRRDVLVGGFMATVVAGLPAAAFAQATRQQALPTAHPNTGTTTMNTITTKDGTEIYFKDWGPKNAQPIVFHHGWPLSGDDWDTQMLYFLD